MSSHDDPKPLSPWVLRVVSWSASIASFVGYAVHKQGPHKPPDSVLDGTFLWISLAFVVLPFVRSLKIGKIVELEREVEKAKETVQDVRVELRQAVSVLAANLSATASARATVNNFAAVQGAEAHPERPVAQTAATSTPPSPRSAIELKILNTLWLYQVARFPDLMPRYTFRIDSPPEEATSFGAGAQNLLFEGLIGQTEDRQVFLTDAGLRYCKANFQTFPADSWFGRPALSPEQVDMALAKIADSK